MGTTMRAFKAALIFFALNTLIACAHEKTEMDRELALRLVDKAGRIEIVQIGGQPLLGPANGSPQAYAPAGNPMQPQEGQTCFSTPIYDMNGRFVRNSNGCY